MLQGHQKAKHKASKEDEIHCSIPPKGASSIVEHINDGGNFIWHNCRETEIHEVRCKHLSKAGNFSALLGDRAWLGNLGAFCSKIHVNICLGLSASLAPGFTDQKLIAANALQGFCLLKLLLSVRRKWVKKLTGERSLADRQWRKVAFIHLQSRYIEPGSHKSCVLPPAQPWRTICRDRGEAESHSPAAGSIQLSINNKNGFFSPFFHGFS